MSTLKLENIKHENSITDNLVMDSDGSVSVTNKLGVGKASNAVGYTLDVDGNVGVGHSSDAAITLDTSGTIQSSIIGMTGRQSGTANTWYMIAAGSGLGAADFRITQGNWISGNNYFKINSDGAVTMPGQPAFHAMASNTNNISSGNLIYSGVTFNTGNHYNSTTGVFTAPIAGAYQFHASCYTQANTGTSVSAKIAVNGVMRQIGEATEVGGNFGYDGINMSVIVYLAANDQVAVQWRAGAQLHLNANNNSFSGALVG